jgi:hypothetical protein
MRVMVCGSRDWIDWNSVRYRLMNLPKDTVVMQGGAAGADNIAWRECERLDLENETYLPDYTRPSPQRYHERNDEMLARADLVLAFWDGKSRGTKSVIEKAKGKGIPVEVIAA